MQPPIIEEVTRLESEGRPDAAMDRLYYYIDSLMSDRMFDEIAEILINTDISKVSTDILLGILTLTLHCKEYLPRRNEFLESFRQILILRQEEDIDGLLRGLE